jgi:hypothetical protein
MATGAVGLRSARDNFAGAGASSVIGTCDTVAPAAGSALSVENSATQASNGQELADAFKKIAGGISNIRLTR